MRLNVKFTNALESWLSLSFMEKKIYPLKNNGGCLEQRIVERKITNYVVDALKIFSYVVFFPLTISAVIIRNHQRNQTIKKIQNEDKLTLSNTNPLLFSKNQEALPSTQSELNNEESTHEKLFLEQIEPKIERDSQIEQLVQKVEKNEQEGALLKQIKEKESGREEEFFKVESKQEVDSPDFTQIDINNITQIAQELKIDDKKISNLWVEKDPSFDVLSEDKLIYRLSDNDRNEIAFNHAYMVDVRPIGMIELDDKLIFDIDAVMNDSNKIVNFISSEEPLYKSSFSFFKQAITGKQFIYCSYSFKKLHKMIKKMTEGKMRNVFEHLFMYMQDQVQQANIKLKKSQNEAPLYLAKDDNSLAYFPRINISYDLPIETLKNSTIVPEHGYTIMKYDTNPVCIGTIDIASCTGVVLNNKEERLIGVAHLDEKTIEGYKESLEELFKAMKGTPQNPVEIYLFSSYSTFKLGAAKGRFKNSLDMNKSLFFSVLDFFSAKNNAAINGIHLSSNADFVATASEEKLQFFNLPVEMQKSHMKNLFNLRELNKIPEGCIDYPQLIQLQSSTIPLTGNKYLKIEIDEQ